MANANAGQIVNRSGQLRNQNPFVEFAALQFVRAG